VIDATGNVFETQYDARGRMVRSIDPYPGLTTGLAGYWSFLEASGDTTDDLSGNGHTGASNGNPQRVQGRMGGALEFDGTDDYVSLGNPGELNIEGAITLAAWVKVAATGDYRNIIAHGYHQNPDREVFLRLNGDNVEVGSWDGTNHLATAELGSEYIGKWVHLAGTYDPVAKEWRLYRNGVQIGQPAPDTVGAVTVPANWTIGAHETTDPTRGRYFQGAIDEVRIYSRALSEDEIKALAGVKTGPVTEYVYDQAGRLSQQIAPDPDGTGPQQSAVTQYAYTPAGAMLSLVDPAGATTTYGYDPAGRQVQVTDPLGNVSYTVFDAAGRVYRQVLPTPDPQQRVPAGLAGWWNFDELGVKGALDWSGNDLTAQSPAEHQLTRVPGISGTAIRFDGATDYLSLGNPSQLQIEGDIAIAAWIKVDDIQDADGIHNIVVHGHQRSPKNL